MSRFDNEDLDRRDNSYVFNKTLINYRKIHSLINNEINYSYGIKKINNHYRDIMVYHKNE